MAKKSVHDVEPVPVDMDGAKGVGMRLMISEADGAPTFNLRVFDVEPGGNTPRHSHSFEHELFFLEGSGEVLLYGEFHPVQAYDCILVPPDEEHCIRNVGDSCLRLICLVPQDQGHPAQDDPTSCGS